MRIYEFITPSDDITFKADDDKIAFACALILGNGKAGCDRLPEGDEKHDVQLPTMLMFQSEPEKTMNEFVGGDFGEFVENNRLKIGECFKSFAYGSKIERALYDEACEAITDPEKLTKFKASHEDKMRTSMSQWVSYAWKLGDGILKKLEEDNNAVN